MVSTEGCFFCSNILCCLSAKLCRRTEVCINCIRVDKLLLSEDTTSEVVDSVNCITSNNWSIVATRVVVWIEDIECECLVFRTISLRCNRNVVVCFATRNATVPTTNLDVVSQTECNTEISIPTMSLNEGLVEVCLKNLRTNLEVERECLCSGEEAAVLKFSIHVPVVFRTVLILVVVVVMNTAKTESQDKLVEKFLGAIVLPCAEKAREIQCCIQTNIPILGLHWPESLTIVVLRIIAYISNHVRVWKCTIV